MAENNIDRNTEAGRPQDGGTPVNGRGRRRAARRPPIKAVDRLLIDENGDARSNYTGDDLSERDYRPVRQSHEYRPAVSVG